MTFDPTKNTTPVGLMSDADLATLKAHGGPYEIWYGTWAEAYPTWIFDAIYRAKTVALTKPSINWDHVAPQFVAMATDSYGYSRLFEEQPTAIKGTGYYQDGWGQMVHTHASFIPGTCDWKDSLLMRPGYGGDK